ncbi:MAG: PTS glucitol/sorbitol transporter subunit IIA [Clostridiales bacterium]|jgi:glucitol/sorbitol PTS system EIIA component|nr:PTS glucitol/sorbitol transporter subunit IIA [Clostridiales bacterium]
MKYKSTVTGIGESVAEFMEAGFIIIFNNNAPQEMADLAVLHTIENLSEDVKVGDTFVISGKQYTVTAVGGEANYTLREMGHCTLKFDGNDTAELPGHIELKGDGVPTVKVGDTIEIL